MSALKFFFKACNVLSDPFTNWMTNSKNITIEKDIVYDESNPKVLTADLYYCKSDNKYPVLINIHGGGFVEGDKKFRRGFSCKMAREGFFVININYGLCPEYKFPYFIENTISALNWAYDNSVKYNLDTDRFVLSGDSSGSFIAAVTAGAVSNEDFLRKISHFSVKGKIKAVLLYCGLYDFDTVCNSSDFVTKNIDYADIITGMTRKELEEKGFFDLISPEVYMTPDYPVTFLTYSKYDLLCKDTSKVMVDTLIKKGVNHKVFEGNNIEDIHCFHLRPIIKNARKCMKETNEFLKEIM